jgi:hypothetical protein
MEGDDEEFDLASVEFDEMLADRPVAPKAAKGAVSHLPVIITNEDKEKEDAGSSWVLITSGEQCCSGALKKKVARAD